MPFLLAIRVRFCLLLCILLLQACAHFPAHAPHSSVPVREFHFDGGGKAIYYVLDKSGVTEMGTSPYPTTYMFVLAGSDCMSMAHVLPDYFDGLEGKAGAIRIFILQKRFIEPLTSDRCSTDFMHADHPSQWIADQSEFIRTELNAARLNGQTPQRIIVLGISEGAEIAPILAHRFSAITHVALIGNGGMDPFDVYQMQAQRHGLQHGPEEIALRCAGDAQDSTPAAERSCRYWTELRAIRHTDNLLALDVPLFIAIGEADTMVPIESAWLIRDKFAERGKTTLHLLMLPNTGHDFRRRGMTMLPYVWEALETWMKK